MRAAGRLAAALLSCAAGAALAAEPQADKALHALFAREFRYGLEEFPERATFFGIEGHDDRFTDRSPGAVARRKARVPKVIAELERFGGG